MNIKENFETWALTQGYSLVEINSNYQVTNTITAWNAWLAATELYRVCRRLFYLS